MELKDLYQIAVIGAGNMGHQIALLCAMHGYRTRATDQSRNALEKARKFAQDYLDSRVQKQKLTAEEASDALSNLSFTPHLPEAAGEADYVIETVTEDLELKRKVFRDLDLLAPPHAILATNSSTFVSSLLADATRRPSQVLNMHFFNPALVMKLVEVVQGPHVAEETARISMGLAERLDKVPVLIRKEVEGFLLNRIFRAINREALWLLDMGVANAEDIDKACVYGAGHPMGPFRLMDLTGIDLNYRVSMERFRRSGDPAERPSPSVVEKYVQGHYGRKSGKGWYNYGPA